MRTDDKVIMVRLGQKGVHFVQDDYGQIVTSWCVARPYSGDMIMIETDAGRALVPTPEAAARYMLAANVQASQPIMPEAPRYEWRAARTALVVLAGLMAALAALPLALV